jgi:polyphenol oxidase
VHSHSGRSSVNPRVAQPDLQAPIDLLQFDLFTGVRHGISTRHGGVSRPPYDTLNLGYSTPDDEDDIAENRSRFLQAVGATPDTVMTAHLTHGNEVAVFDAAQVDRWPRSWHPVRAGSHRSTWVFETDGVVSNVPGLTFFMTAADCTPLLLWDRSRDMVGAAHAGWRGTARGIATNVLQAMTESFGTDPSDVVAGIGPSMGPCCYTVGMDVIEAFASAGIEPVLITDDGPTRLDLWESNRRQLLDGGVPAASIETMGLCTGCHVSTFFSHRAEAGRTGRMACAIGLG